MDPYLKGQLRQILTYAAPSTLDVAGQVQLGSSATCFARIETRTREIPVGSDVIEDRTDHVIILDETFPLSESEARSGQYLLPGQTDYRRAKIVSVMIDEFGATDHWEVIV